MNPAVVEKELVDISLRAGVNESDRPEVLDWTKYLTRAENVSYEQPGSLIKRPGTNYVGYVADDASYISYPLRAHPMAGGYCVTAVSGTLRNQLYQLNEAAGIMTRKGPMPDYGIDFMAVPGSSEDISDNFISSTATAAFKIGNYYAVLVKEHSAQNSHTVYLLDYYSGNIVKSFRITDSVTWTSDTVCTMCPVGTNYIHVYTSRSSTTVGQGLMRSIDLTTMTISISTTLTATGYVVDCVALPDGSGSVVLTNYLGGVPSGNLEKFGPTGTSLATAASATVWTGIAVDDNSRVYVIGYNAGYRWSIYNSSLVVQSSRTDATTAAHGAYPRIAIDPATGLGRVISFTNTPYRGKVYYFDPTADLAAIGTIVGWSEASVPFFDPNHGRYGVAIHKHLYQSADTSTVDQNAALVVADITESIGVSGAGNRFRVMANLDNKYTHYTVTDTTTTPSFRYVVIRPYYQDNLYIPTTYRAGPSSVGHQVAILRQRYAKQISGTRDGYISGGAVSAYDGKEPGELGFFDAPGISVTAGAGALTAGTRAYVAVYEYTDAAGRTHFSRTSQVATKANTVSNLIKVTLPSVGNRTGLIRCNLYRTTDGGNTYYYLTSLTNVTNATSPNVYYADYDDTMSDTTLASRPIFYRTPGIAGTALDRYAPPPSCHIVNHKDRLVVCSGSVVFYSSFFVDGEAPWFNAALSIYIPGGTGPITGLASMDGALVVFKRDGIWIVDGDGPPENGGSGMEFSAPRRIATEYGCVDPRTIVSTPEGTMYRSVRGIELLTRSMQVAFIGQNVQATTDANPHTGGACFDRKTGRVLFVMGAGESIAGTGQLYYAGQGVVAVLDITTGAWSVHKHTNGGVYYGGALQDVCVVDYGDLGDTVFYSDTIYYTQFETSSYHGDISNGYYTPMVLETGWIKIKPQERIRVSDFLVLAKKGDNHNLKVSIAYDYSDTYEYTRTYTPANINDLEQLELPIPRQTVQAIRFKIEDEAPADLETYPVTTGAGPEIIALTVKMGLRGGGAKLAATQKG